MQTSRYMHLLAVVDDDGYATIYDTRRRLPSYDSAREKSARAKVRDWFAHDNAIFDVCWIKDDSQIVTASGDQRVKIWSVEKGACVGILSGHNGSVKTISPHSRNHDLIVTGARDGAFALWDLRCNNTHTNRHGEACLSFAVAVNDAHALAKGKGGRLRKASSMSITSVLYLKDDITVATAGAVDSVIKFWDTRILRSPIALSGPSTETSNLKEGSQHGITSLSQDSFGASLVASCLDNRIYLYDVFHLDKGPKKVFSGSKIETFFVKSVISPDGSHILGGSSDGNAYIWQVAEPERAPSMLKGHEEEVTSVAWCPSDIGKIATSDDSMVRLWNTMTESCLNTASPAAVRKRITAPYTDCRKPILDEPTTNSIKTVADNYFHAPAEASKEPSSPAQNKQVEFSTPECQKKKSFSSFMSEEMATRKSPENTLNSPSSVLNPPSSVKRKTILDYFAATL